MYVSQNWYPLPRKQIMMRITKCTLCQNRSVKNYQSLAVRLYCHDFGGKNNQLTFHPGTVSDKQDSS